MNAGTFSIENIGLNSKHRALTGAYQLVEKPLENFGKFRNVLYLKYLQSRGYSQRREFCLFAQ